MKRVMSSAKNGELPTRYHERWRDPFDSRVSAVLQPNMAILDVGSGRRPALDPSQRPPGCRYVGLDISEAELKLAQVGSYDEIRVSDVTQRVPELEDRFDLIVSWQVLEHVRSLEQALANMHAYLHPRGTMVAQFSGKYSVFGIINSLVPHRFGIWVMHKLLRRDPDTVFPAYYDQCSYDSITELLDGWTDYRIEPKYVGAGYFRFSRVLQRLYLRVENRFVQNERVNLASHYIVSATR